MAANEAWCDFRVVNVGKILVDDGLRCLAGRNFDVTANMNGDEQFQRLTKELFLLGLRQILA